MSTVQLSNFKFQTPMVYLYEALEDIKAYTIVFIVNDVVNDEGTIKVYSNQYNSAIHGKSPCLLGIAQNDALKGETVKVITSGVSPVIFYSRGLGLNQDVYVFGKDDNFKETKEMKKEDLKLIHEGINQFVFRDDVFTDTITSSSYTPEQQFFKGVTCLKDESGISPYIQETGYPIKLGRILPSTKQYEGLTLNPYTKVMNILIDLEYE